MAKCELCGEPMPPGEEMFKYHGYSGSCPKPPMRTRTPAEICREIAQDMANDAKHFDGMLFTGKTVAEYFGNQGAAIAALANIIALHLDASEVRR